MDNNTFGQIALSVIGGVTLLLTGAFAWLKSDIIGLKSDLAAAHKKHEECEKKRDECVEARHQDALRIQRLEMAAEVLGDRTGAGQEIRDTLKPASLGA